MRASVILFCFLWAVLDSMYVENNEEGVSLVTTTTSSVTLRWKLGENERKLNYTITLRYWPTTLVPEPATLDWNLVGQYCVASKGKIIPDKEAVHGLIPTFHRNGMKFTVSNLKFTGTEYGFCVQRIIDGRKYGKSVEIMARTRSVPPKYPPKVGAGSFVVSKVSASNRTVKIIWPAVLRDEYEVRVYEDGQSPPLYTGCGAMNAGFLFFTLSFKRHDFIFKAINYAGHSETTSKVTIPAQDDLLPAPSNFRYCHTKDGIYSFTWKNPEIRAITNVTIFWVDSMRSERVVHILDFLYAPNAQNSFEVKGDGFVGLALSVNTESSSSGLKVPQLV